MSLLSKFSISTLDFFQAYKKKALHFIVILNQMLFFLFVFQIQVSFSQTFEPSKTTYKSRLGLAQEVKGKNDELFTGVIHFSNGELTCREGKIVQQIEFYRNGNKSSVANLKDGKQHGLQEFYYKNGQLQMQFTLNADRPIYKKGKKTWNEGQFIEGNLVCYYQNGTIQMEEFSNENGNLQGIQKYFYPNAQLRNQFQYEDGTLNGEQKQYYENGKIKREVFFENGKLIRQRCWDEKGIEMLFCK
jgi:antitoxin component YwqK of YwqJK toxin-antitoxin module